jgi:hypothetical protein
MPDTNVGAGHARRSVSLAGYQGLLHGARRHARIAHSLKGHSHSQLNQPPEISLLDNLSEICISERGVRTVEYGGVERIQRLGAELPLKALLDGERLHQREIEVGCTRTPVAKSPAHVTERELRRHGESFGIEVPVQTVLNPAAGHGRDPRGVRSLDARPDHRIEILVLDDGERIAGLNQGDRIDLPAPRNMFQDPPATLAKRQLVGPAALKLLGESTRASPYSAARL